MSSEDVVKKLLDDALKAAESGSFTMDETDETNEKFHKIRWERSCAIIEYIDLKGTLLSSMFLNPEKVFTKTNEHDIALIKTVCITVLSTLAKDRDVFLKIMKESDEILRSYGK